MTSLQSFTSLSLALSLSPLQEQVQPDFTLLEPDNLRSTSTPLHVCHIIYSKTIWLHTIALSIHTIQWRKMLNMTRTPTSREKDKRWLHNKRINTSGMLCKAMARAKFRPTRRPYTTLKRNLIGVSKYRQYGSEEPKFKDCQWFPSGSSFSNFQINEEWKL